MHGCRIFRLAFPKEEFYPSLWDRHTLDWDTSGTFSRVLEPGPFHALEVQEAFIEVDTSSVWETGPKHLRSASLVLAPE
jgi:hypothetical protein